MGMNNKQRRAAKKRQRMARQSRSTGPDQSTPSASDRAETALISAVRLCTLGRPPAACAGGLGDVWRGSRSAVEGTIDSLAVDSAAALFQDGWTPVDLHEIARRKLDAGPGSFVVDLVAAATARYPQQRVDPRWLAELTAIGGEVWWDQRRPLFGQWASRHGYDGPSALAIAVETMSLMGSLVRLEPSLAPPGTIDAADAAPGPTEDRMLAKVRGLLAKAEATDFDDEAEALSAKAQQLMSRYAIDHAMLSRPRRSERAALRRMWLAAPYVRAKSMLVSAVADANRCRAVLSEQAGFVTIVGAETDLRLVGLLATSLLVQATRSVAAARPQPAAGGISRTRSFRQSFLVSYASRIGERLRETSQAVQAEADQSRWLPVLAARTRAVDDAVREHFPHLVERDVSVGNHAGWVAGRAAADLALFDVATPLAREKAG